MKKSLAQMDGVPGVAETPWICVRLISLGSTMGPERHPSVVPRWWAV